MDAREAFDSFRFTNDNAALAGSIVSGGTNTLDFSARTGATTLDLRTRSLAGIDGAGAMAGLLGGFSGIGTVLGGTSSLDSVLGADTANHWHIDAADAARVDAGLAFTGLENLRGGGADDVFQFDAGGALTGLLVGGGGTDVLALTLAGGNDQVWLQADALGFNGSVVRHADIDTVQIDTAGGDDHIRIGSGMAQDVGGLLAPLASAITVAGGSGSDVLVLDDQRNAAATRGTVAAGAVTGFGLRAGLSYGGLESLQVLLGLGNDIAVVAATHAGDTVLSDGADNVIVMTTQGTLTVDAGTGNDTVGVRAITARTTLLAGLGDDTINVSTPGRGTGGTATGGPGRETGGTLDNLGALLMVDGQGGNDLLFLDDTGDSKANTGTLSGDSTGEVTGLGMAAGVQYSRIGNLSLKLGAGNDSISLLGSAATTTTLHTGGGSDTVVVRGTGTGDTVVRTGDGADNVVVMATRGTLTVDTGAGNDGIGVRAIGARMTVLAGLGDGTINVSTPGRGVVGTASGASGGAGRETGGTLDNIGALLVVDGQGGNDLLFLDDTGDSKANRGELTAQRGSVAGEVTGLGMAAGLQYSRIASLSIKLGSGNDTVSVRSTAAGITTVDTGAGNDTVTVFGVGMGDTTLFGNSGNDSFNVHATSAPLTLRGGVGDDIFRLGSLAPAMQGGLLGGIDGLVTISGDTGSDSLLLDDSGNPAPTAPQLGHGRIGGMGMAQGIVHDGVESVLLPQRPSSTPPPSLPKPLQAAVSIDWGSYKPAAAAKPAATSGWVQEFLGISSRSSLATSPNAAIRLTVPLTSTVLRPTQR